MLPSLKFLPLVYKDINILNQIIGERYCGVLKMATEATDTENISSTYPSYPGKSKEKKKDAKASSITLSIEAQNKKPFVIVAIPAFNEEVAIGSVVVRCKKYVDKVIVVDDGSKDHTVEIAKLVGAEVISHKVNGGYGAAIKTCFETCKAYNADIMIIIDADGQHSPDDIPILLEEMKKSNSDIVIGSRFINGNGHKQKIPVYRKVGMKVLDTATGVGSGVHVSDSQSGFRAYSNNAIKSITLGSNGMSAGSEILMQAANKNLKITEVPISVRYDIKGTSSKSPISHGFEVLGSIIKLISESRPLLFFCVPGALLLVIGTIFAFLTFDKFNITRNISIYYILIGTLCFLVGIFSIFTGFILSSIQQIKSKN